MSGHEGGNCMPCSECIGTKCHSTQRADGEKSALNPSDGQSHTIIESFDGNTCGERDGIAVSYTSSTRFLVIYALYTRSLAHTRPLSDFQTVSLVLPLIDLRPRNTIHTYGHRNLKSLGNKPFLRNPHHTPLIPTHLFQKTGFLFFSQC